MDSIQNRGNPVGCQVMKKPDAAGEIEVFGGAALEVPKSVCSLEHGTAKAVRLSFLPRHGQHGGTVVNADILLKTSAKPQYHV